MNLFQKTVLVLIIFSSGCQVEKKEDKLFDASKPFQVAFYERVMGDNIDEYLEKACNDWRIETDKIHELISSFEKINGQDWHYNYSHFECSFEGKIIQKNNEFNFSINGGSWMTISQQDSTYFYGDEERQFKSLFLDSKLTWEEMK